MTLRKSAASLLLSLLTAFFLFGCQRETVSSSGPDSGPEGSAFSQVSSAQPSSAPRQEEASSLPAGDSAAPTPIPLPTVRVTVKADAPLYENPEPETPLLIVPAGTAFQVSLQEKDPFWRRVETQGAAGYLYTENLYLTEDGSASEISLWQKTFRETLARLQSQLPQDMYWNHAEIDASEDAALSPWIVTDIPCEHELNWDLYCNVYNGKLQEHFPEYDDLRQCLGFVSLISDQFFGKEAELHVFEDMDLLRVGDHIRLEEWEHSMIVTEIGEEGILLGEVNANYEDCRITWDHEMTWEELEGLDWDAEYISRYPLAWEEDGSFSPWP